MNLSDNRSSAAEDGFAGASNTAGEEPMEQDDKFWVKSFKRSLDAASRYQSEKLNTAWSRNYRAYSNRHFNGSKYDTARYRNRSKLFKPKTRMAVRKNDATAAGALFSTEDVVSVTPERASDKLQTSTAQFLHEVLNYRLDRGTKFTGPNWFLTAIGARQDSQITGICVSKQYWEYEERKVQEIVTKTRDEPMVDPNGLPMLDDMGQPIIEEVTTEEIEEFTEVVRDRLMITLIPPEQAFIDMTGDWRDPIQEGGSFTAAYPMRLNDLKTMIKAQSDRPVVGGGAWRTDIDIDKLTQGRGANRQQAATVRQSREDGVDRYESRHAGKDNDVIWVYEHFTRIDGEDMHYWMLGETIPLSDPRPTRESYPAHDGDRPYVRGLGALESHKTHPMSPVESWQPMQFEINDITNLNLDAMKMAISPITKIMKGRGIDLKQVQNRGPDAAVLVTGQDDVMFDRAPSPDGSAMQNMHIISNDFDELAGVFSGGSVQSNRTLNETVGGMQLLASSANSLTEYDLRIWVETWAEPVLRQCIELIKFYETDETAIGVAGEKCGLIGNIDPLPDEPPQEEPQPGMGGAPPEQGMEGMGAPPPMPEQPVEPPEPKITLTEVMRNLENAKTSVRINVGIGALDSRQKLEKLMGALSMTREMAEPLDMQGYQINAKEVVQEIWGLAGWRDADRFFMTKKPPPDQGPPPEVQLEQIKQEGAIKKVEAQGQVDTGIEQMRLQAETGMSAEENSLRERELALAEREQAHKERMDRLEAMLGRIESMEALRQPEQPRRDPQPF